jgi:hypothetical protein
MYLIALQAFPVHQIIVFTMLTKLALLALASSASAVFFGCYPPTAFTGEVTLRVAFVNCINNPELC